MDFWLVLSKNDSNIICSSIKNESFLKIWRVWHILKVCHALWYLKIEMGIAGSIFELHPPNFQKMCIFWRFTNDISTIFCYLLWFQFWKKCQSLPVHPRVVPDYDNDWPWANSNPGLVIRMGPGPRGRLFLETSNFESWQLWSPLMYRPYIYSIERSKPF